MVVSKVKYFILFFLIIFLGCTKKEETAVITKTGIELFTVGSINYGNVILGEYRESTIRVINHGPNAINDFNPVLSAPFSINKISAPCNSGSIPVNATCNIIVRFSPITKGSFQTDFILEDKSQKIAGLGVDSAGYLTFSLSSWDLGTVIAGETSYKEIDVTNSGDFTVQTPSINTLTGYSLVYNECGNYISPKKTCRMRFSIIKQTIGSNVDNLIFTTIGITPYNLTVFSQVIPGPPEGGIVFNNSPVSIIADGGSDVRSFSTFPIRDQFGNVVVDGTEVNLLVSNLNIVGQSLKTTVGGIVSFSISSTNQRGDATITVLSGSASGFSRFKSISGPGVGEITAKNHINTVEANGVSQIDIRFNPIRDQFNNVIEDGSQVNFYLKETGTNCLNESSSNNGSGTLMSSVQNTILGEVGVTIIPPTTIGQSVLIVKSGTACGSFPLYFIPGTATGTIALSSNVNGIFSDPSTGILADPPETIQSTITVGPVKDQFNNIVSENTEINISLINAIGVSSGTSSFLITTDAGGFSTFSIQGTGTRGYITINVSKDTASGSLQIWAYGNTTLRPISPNLSTNPFKIFMSYFSINNDPDAISGWGLIKSWSNLDIQDKNYFGDLKKQAGPTLIDNNLPYFMSYCLFSAENISYGSNCFDSSFNDGSIFPYTLKLTKGNKIGDPGASLLTQFFNMSRGSEIHNEQQTGCFKQDLQPGSPTINEFLFYKNSPQDKCNGLTSNDPNSPVYLNDNNPWFGGSWNSKNYDLKFSSIGFIPDLAKVLVFGGYYESPVYGGGFLSPNNFEVSLSNLNTWSGNYGIDVPFNWKEENNLNEIFGDFPEQSIMPSFSNSSKDLFLFGGLIFSGNSHNNSGPILNYISSSVSDQFLAFSGILNKWKRILINEDPLVSGNDEPHSPLGRYQHGMVYIPDTDSLFIANGKTKLISNGSWIETNDMWSVKDISNYENLEWERRCYPCGFPSNVHNHPNDLNPQSIDPTPLKMTYHPFLQKVFMLWSGTSFGTSNFNPLTSSRNISINHINNYSFSSIEDSSLYDMEINQNIGRTYFYKRKTKNAYDSEIYYWDMDPGNKQYLKIEVDLGTPAKTFVRSLGVNVRGYGSIKDSSELIQGIGGIIVKIFNNDTDQWDLVGQNTSSIESQDTLVQSINVMFNQSQSINYIDNSGKVRVLIYPKDNTNFSGSGYNELKLDEFYINGLF